MSCRDCSACKRPCPTPAACEVPDHHDSMAKPNGTGLPVLLLVVAVVFAAIAAAAFAWGATR